MKGFYMGRATTSACALAVMAIAIGMLAPPSHAQDAEGRIPQNPTLDDFGVDVQGNGFFQEFKELSIGPEDHKGLQHIRYLTAQWWKTNFWNDVIARTTWMNPFPSATGEFGSLTRVVGDTSTPPTGDGSYLSTWVWTEGTPWMLGTKDGRVVEYAKIKFDSPADSSGTAQQARVATRVTFPDGTIWTIHNRYHVSGPITYSRIQSVTNNLGYQIKYEYESDVYSVGDWTKLTKATAINNAIEYCDPMADRCTLSQPWSSSSYSYSGTTQFVTDASGGVSQFTGESISPSVSKIKLKRPGSANWDAEYTLLRTATPCYPQEGYPSGNCLSRLRVTNALIEGVSRNYSYSYSPSLSTWTVQASTPNGTRKYVSITHTNWGLYDGVSEFVDELGRSSKFEYSLARLAKSTTPEGNYFSLTRDGSGNVTETRQVAKSGSGLPNLVSTSTFGAASMGRPTSTVDNKGSEANFEYSTIHGGILKRTDPAVNGVRPETRYEYAQRYAWIKNSAGAYVQASSPVWLLIRERFCKSTAASGAGCAGGAVDEVITDYDYGSDSGPNNLLLRGVSIAAGGETLRTCYGYDISGRKISETKPAGAAGLTGCP